MKGSFLISYIKTTVHDVNMLAHIWHYPRRWLNMYITSNHMSVPLYKYFSENLFIRNHVCALLGELRGK
jgi:hypothetical protein